MMFSLLLLCCSISLFNDVFQFLTYRRGFENKEVNKMEVKIVM